MHAETAGFTRGLFGDVPDFNDQRHIRSPVRSIELARNVEWKQRAYEYGAALLNGSLAGSPVPVMRFYGGIKQEQSIESKIHAYRVGDPLELDDVIRFRFVLGSLEEMLTFYRFFAGICDVERCRNYYLRPRRGPANPYRALHLRIAGFESGPVEVQILTVLRDAVGIVDHLLALKRSVNDISMQHSQWLSVISLVANIVDCERVRSQTVENENDSARARCPVARQHVLLPAINHEGVEDAQEIRNQTALP